ATGIPFIEVHLSNPHAREPFRHTSHFSDLAVGVIAGFGADSYRYALDAAISRLAGPANRPKKRRHMDLRKIKKLIDLLAASNLSEIEIKEGEESVRLARAPRGGVAMPAPMQAVAHEPLRTMPMQSPVDGPTGGPADAGGPA